MAECANPIRVTRWVATMSETEYTQVAFRVPQHIKERAMEKTEHGEMTENIRSLYEQVAFGEEVAEHQQLKLELDRVREKKDQKRGKIRTLQSELEDLERKETRLEERLQQKQSKADEYRVILETLEKQLRDGQRILESNQSVQDAASIKNIEPADIIDELQSRNPDVPNYAFRPFNEDRKEWGGLE